MGDTKDKSTVSKSVLFVSVCIAIILTAIIVGMITFAWQNGQLTNDDLFRQQLLQTETDSLEKQMNTLNRIEE